MLIYEQNLYLPQSKQHAGRREEQRRELVSEVKITLYLFICSTDTFLLRIRLCFECITSIPLIMLRVVVYCMTYKMGSGLDV
jgi:hypothetical protein